MDGVFDVVLVRWVSWMDFSMLYCLSFFVEIPLSWVILPCLSEEGKQMLDHIGGLGLGRRFPVSFLIVKLLRTGSEIFWCVELLR